ncbi:putative oxidoreductase [Frankliniella fusca]|uniref:Oxidoreductase n=1 Tax=Frankliniella fusca TaxID=407009 RepID=A0AAE1I1P1_9NEOP|nr:putative oxidoreductase [Frankliniella fusca]
MYSHRQQVASPSWKRLPKIVTEKTNLAHLKSAIFSDLLCWLNINSDGESSRGQWICFYHRSESSWHNIFSLLQNY